MPIFGKRSKNKLSTTHPDLVKLANHVIKRYDIGVYESSRTTARQITMFNTGKSQIDGISKRSKHQVSVSEPLSRAIDCFPYERGHNSFDGSPKSRLMFWEMVWHFKRASAELGIPIECGAFWSFKDMPHIELV